jgi:signal transduction histidine kinase
VDLSSIANHVGTELKALRDGTLIVRPGILVQGDPELLELVLVNLMENAWKYVLPDQPPHVEVGITQDGAVFVRDQGVGFDMKYVEKVWEPFERLHKESDYPGTGIGLANSKRVIDRHGGRIWTESAPGKGTTVYFTVGNATAPLEFSSTSEVRRRARVR